MMQIRKIQMKDNAAVEKIIKETLMEFDAAVPGTAFMDNSISNMFDAYQTRKSAYFVAYNAGNIIGGCGISPLRGDNTNTAELQKMYIAKSHRGKGIGTQLLKSCLDYAKKQGYSGIYLETLPNMKEAGGLYQTAGFKYLSEKMGNTGHSTCHVWMYLKL